MKRSWIIFVIGRTRVGQLTQVSQAIIDAHRETLAKENGVTIDKVMVRQ